MFITQPLTNFCFFTIIRNGTEITICCTNILIDKENKPFHTLFCKTSYQKTLRDLISCGEYNKTQKRSTPMYCFGSTITCTRFPKFFAEGKPQIQPRPYFTSKPNQKGYEIIRKPWMQSFLKEAELQVLHYLHNLCSDTKLKKITLLNLELSKKIIPECLRLGDIFWTHMSVFSTLNKEDGQMPIHFDERDVISCVFHLGKVLEGGATSYYSGDHAMEPKDKIHSVPFHHGTLQIGFFNKILHGVDDWKGQRCGIQINIKKDLLKHFIKFGTEHYNKFRITGYPQGPIIYY